MAFIFRSISTHFSNDLSYTTVIVHYRSAAFQHIIYVYTCNHQSAPRTSNISTTDFNINRTILQCMYIMGVLCRHKHLVYSSCIISQQNISGTVLVSSHSKTSRVPFIIISVWDVSLDDISYMYVYRIGQGKPSLSQFCRNDKKHRITHLCERY